MIVHIFSFGSVCLIVRSDSNPDLVLIRVSILNLVVRTVEQANFTPLSEVPTSFRGREGVQW